MNIFGFIRNDAVIAYVAAYAYGVVIGMVLSVARFLIFTILERKE